MAKKTPVKRVGTVKKTMPTKKGSGAKAGGTRRPNTKTQREDPLLNRNPKRRRVKK